MKLKIERAVLVYQGGLANVFKVDSLSLHPVGRNAKRLMQSDFSSCVMFASGLAEAGTIVRTMACNMAGDIAECTWTNDLEAQPFSDKLIDITKNS